ncbi:MAG: hypothetical protein AB1432_15305 [Bacteroidota bacterium]
MEIKTGKSTKSILRLMNGVTDAIILDKQSGQKFTLRSVVGSEVKDLLGKMVITA